MSFPLLDIINVSKNFHQNKVLDRISLRISQKEIVGLVGPNGVGKTTTIRLALGTLNQDAGQIIRYNKKEKHKGLPQLGYMPEFSPLFESYNVDSYLNLMSKIKNPADGFSRREIDRIISKFDLNSIKGRVIGNLSKGTKQRVGLAQAFLGDPKLLLLDEPLSGLDPIQSKDVKDIIIEFSRNAGILLSTHAIHDVVTLCNRAYLLNQGKIFELDLSLRDESSLTSQIIRLIKGRD